MKLSFGLEIIADVTNKATCFISATREKFDRWTTSQMKSPQVAYYLANKYGDTCQMIYFYAKILICKQN